MEMQGTQNSQNNFEKKEQSYRTHTPWFQNWISMFSNQESVVLAEG